VFTYKHNYVFLEKQLKKAYTSDYENELYPTQDEIKERMSKIINHTQFQAFVKNLKEDLNESRLVGDERGNIDDNRKALLVEIVSRIEDNKTKYPTFGNESLNLNEIHTKLQGTLDNSFKDMFILSNEISDVTSQGVFPLSKILKNSDFQLIMNWLPNGFNNSRPELLYQSSRDGKSISAITQKSFGKGSTLIVYKSSGGKVFGGFMDLDWKDYNNYFKSQKAFLFSVTNKKKYEWNGTANNGYTDYSLYGPAFADDLYVSGNFNGHCAPGAYVFPSGDEVAGSISFVTVELEVYAVKGRN
jgi:hypothetical protein